MKKAKKKVKKIKKTEMKKIKGGVNPEFGKSMMRNAILPPQR